MAAVPDSGDVEPDRTVAQQVHAVAKPIRVLASLRWPESVRDEFLPSAWRGTTRPPTWRPSSNEA